MPPNPPTVARAPLGKVVIMGMKVWVRTVTVEEEGGKGPKKKGGVLPCSTLPPPPTPPPPYSGDAPLGKGGGHEGVGENCVNGTEGEKGGGGAISL